MRTPERPTSVRETRSLVPPYPEEVAYALKMQMEACLDAYKTCVRAGLADSAKGHMQMFLAARKRLETLTR